VPTRVLGRRECGSVIRRATKAQFDFVAANYPNIKTDPDRSRAFSLAANTPTAEGQPRAPLPPLPCPPGAQLMRLRWRSRQGRFRAEMLRQKALWRPGPPRPGPPRRRRTRALAPPPPALTLAGGSLQGPCRRRRPREAAARDGARGRV